MFKKETILLLLVSLGSTLYSMNPFVTHIPRPLCQTKENDDDSSVTTHTSSQSDGGFKLNVKATPFIPASKLHPKVKEVYDRVKDLNDSQAQEIRFLIEQDLWDKRDYKAKNDKNNYRTYGEKFIDENKLEALDYWLDLLESKNQSELPHYTHGRSGRNLLPFLIEKNFENKSPHTKCSHLWKKIIKLDPSTLINEGSNNPYRHCAFYYPTYLPTLIDNTSLYNTSSLDEKHKNRDNNKIFKALNEEKFSFFNTSLLEIIEQHPTLTPEEKIKIKYNLGRFPDKSKDEIISLIQTQESFPKEFYTIFKFDSSQKQRSNALNTLISDHSFLLDKANNAYKGQSIGHHLLYVQDFENFTKWLQATPACSVIAKYDYQYKHPNLQNNKLHSKDVRGLRKSKHSIFEAFCLKARSDIHNISELTDLILQKEQNSIPHGNYHQSIYFAITNLNLNDHDTLKILQQLHRTNKSAFNNSVKKIVHSRIYYRQTDIYSLESNKQQSVAFLKNIDESTLTNDESEPDEIINDTYSESTEVIHDTDSESSEVIDDTDSESSNDQQILNNLIISLQKNALFNYQSPYENKAATLKLTN